MVYWWFCSKSPNPVTNSIMFETGWSLVLVALEPRHDQSPLVSLLACLELATGTSSLKYGENFSKSVRDRLKALGDFACVWCMCFLKVTWLPAHLLWTRAHPSVKGDAGGHVDMNLMSLHFFKWEGFFHTFELFSFLKSVHVFFINSSASISVVSFSDWSATTKWRARKSASGRGGRLGNLFLHAGWDVLSKKPVNLAKVKPRINGKKSWAFVTRLDV